MFQPFMYYGMLPQSTVKYYYTYTGWFRPALPRHGTYSVDWKSARLCIPMTRCAYMRDAL